MESQGWKRVNPISAQDLIVTKMALENFSTDDKTTIQRGLTNIPEGERLSLTITCYTITSFVTATLEMYLVLLDKNGQPALMYYYRKNVML
jgi:hypothetical protein